MQLLLLLCFLWNVLSLNDPTARLTPSEVEQTALLEDLPLLNMGLNQDAGWSPYQPTVFQTPGRRRYGNLCLLTGIIAKRLTEPMTSGTVAALPHGRIIPGEDNGCIPPNRVMLSPSANTAAWKCQVGSTGTVSWQGGGVPVDNGNGNFWLSFDGAFFATQQGRSLQLATGWVNRATLPDSNAWQTANVNSMTSSSGGSLCWVEGTIVSPEGFELATFDQVAALNPQAGVGPGVIALLPPDCRPAKNRIFHVASWKQKTESLRVVVKPTGEIILTNTGSTWAELRAQFPNAQPWVSLNGIIFDTATITPLALAPGLSPLGTCSGSEYQEPGYSLVGPLCVLAGTLSDFGGLNNGGYSPPRTTDELVLANLPAACQPIARLVFAVNQWSTEARVDITPTGEVIAVNVKGIQTLLLSLDGILFDTKAV